MAAADDTGDGWWWNSPAPTGAGTVTARYVVGCDGGRSVTTSPDGGVVRGDDITDPMAGRRSGDRSTRTPEHRGGRRPGATQRVGVDRPWHPQVRVHDPSGESDEEAQRPEFLAKLLRPWCRTRTDLDVIRRRVYTHHSRIAGAFRKGRILLAGDAAHLMPVWQGQGYNSGIRDAANLGWKLAAVVTGRADDALLDTYDTERRSHARAMIDLSTMVGRVISPTNRRVAAARDLLIRGASVLPALKNYVLTMRFKPMPRYEHGAVVHADPRPPRSAVGTLFIQPRVDTRDRTGALLDDVLGTWFSVLCWNNHPRTVLGDAAVRAVEGPGRHVHHRPADVPARMDRSRRPRRDRDRRHRRSGEALVRRADRLGSVPAAGPMHRRGLCGATGTGDQCRTTRRTRIGARRNNEKGEPMPLALCCVSHSPLLELPGTPPDLVDEVGSALEEAADFVRDWDPELVVIFSPDHYNGFFYRVMPPFCIGNAARGVGDYGTRLIRSMCPRDLADACARAVLEAGVDVAVSESMDVDHGTVQPLQRLLGDARARPVIPIFVNSVAAPLGPLHRVRALGHCGGSATWPDWISGCSSSDPGGLSHDPPVPTLATATGGVRERMVHGGSQTPEQRSARQSAVIEAARDFAAGRGPLRPLNPDWDREFLAIVDSGRLDEFDGWSNARITTDAGSSAHEVRTWVAAFAAMATQGPTRRRCATTVPRRN